MAQNENAGAPRKETPASTAETDASPLVACAGFASEDRCDEVNARYRAVDRAVARGDSAAEELRIATRIRDIHLDEVVMRSSGPERVRRYRNWPRR